MCFSLSQDVGRRQGAHLWLPLLWTRGVAGCRVFPRLIFIVDVWHPWADTPSETQSSCNSSILCRLRTCWRETTFWFSLLDVGIDLQTPQPLNFLICSLKNSKTSSQGWKTLKGRSPHCNSYRKYLPISSMTAPIWCLIPGEPMIASTLAGQIYFFSLE